MNPLTIVIIVIMLVLIIYLISYIFSDPYTLQQMQNGQTVSVIKASSLSSNSGTNAESTNFAYSIWFYVNDWNYRYGEPKVIFGRMGAPTNTSDTPTTDVSGIDPCPSIVLDAVQNNLIISLSCFPGDGNTTTTTSVVETCNVSNVAIQRWVNLIVSVYGRSMDVYIDGKLVKTCLLPGVANVNNSADVYVTPSGGFSGWTSKFQYYPYPINPQEAWNIYSNGFSSWFTSITNMFSSYNIQISLIENGTTKNSLTL